MEVTKKDINNIRSAMRTAFNRSDYRKAFLQPYREEVTLYRKDGTVSKQKKVVYPCNQCGGKFPQDQINVDHILAVGSLKCIEDVPRFTRRLWCGYENLQILCVTCHHTKTQNERLAKKV